jgi:riboflavin kinase/FMN adenylyltransferase
VTNVGIKPTFGGEALTIEAFLLDYQGPEIYGHLLELKFVAKLRDEQKFPGIDALKAQIAKDVEKAKAILR